MIETIEKTNAYLADFERMKSDGKPAGPAWLAETRQAAIERFGVLGFPTTRHEEWNFTNVAAIAGARFSPAEAAEVSADAISEHALGAAATLAFVNGRYAPELSSTSSLPSGVTVMTLGDAFLADTAPVREHLARHVSFENQAFAALNTALFSDGAFVHVARGVTFESPIQLIFVSTATDAPHAAHPRVLIVAESSSQVTVVETHVGLGGGVYFNNAVTEIVAQDNAVVDHYKVGRESESAFHVGTLQIHQHRDANVSSSVFTFGGSIVRNNINTLLDGEGGECTLNGLYMLGGSQHVDNHLLVDHARPHCDSREYFKGILDDESHGVFTGRIIVREDAQKTDGKQSNQNLLLSDRALADSKPQLEIFADDVKCTHGVTIGQIDGDAIFYLRSRGIGERTARSLLVYAFAAECIGRVRVEALRKKLEDLIYAKLPETRVLRDVS